MRSHSTPALLLPTLLLLIAGAAGARREHLHLNMMASGEHGEGLEVEHDFERLDHHMMASGEHGEGLEAEHDFKVVYRSNRSDWAVNEHDKAVLGKIVKVLNPEGADSVFEWEDCSNDWTFGLVKLTASTPKGSLALHMLHRHGLAPLIASRAGKAFDDFLAKRSVGNDEGKLEFLVESEEEFDQVQAMRVLLESMTLSGLRNLHSFDHSWSVRKWSEKIGGCSQSTPQSCLLQAGTSATAWKFLQSHGFTLELTSKVKQEMQQLLGELTAGNTGLKPGMIGDFLLPGHTGKKTLIGRIEKDVHGPYLSGLVSWEGGGLTRLLRVNLTDDQLKTFLSKSGDDAQNYAESLVESAFEEASATHKTVMRERRLTVWTSEESDFWDMYPRYLEAAAWPVSPVLWLSLISAVILKEASAEW